MTANKWKRDRFNKLDEADLESLEVFVQAMLQIAQPMDGKEPTHTTKVRRVIARLALEKFLGRKKPEKKDVSKQEDSSTPA